MLRQTLRSMSHEKLTASRAVADCLNMTVLVSKKEAWREVTLLAEMLNRLFLEPHLEFFSLKQHNQDLTALLSLDQNNEDF